MFNLITYFIFLLIFKFHGFNASETQIIRVSHKRHNEEFTVTKDKPLQIIFDDSACVLLSCFNFYLNNGTSSQVFGYSGSFKQETKFKCAVNNIIEVQNVTDDMSTRWKCSLLQDFHGPPSIRIANKNYTQIELFFNLHVKRAREVMLTVNDVFIKAVTTDVTTDYDAEAHYRYYEGEDVDLKCKLINHGSHLDSLRLEYYNEQGGLIFKTMTSTIRNQEFRSVLKLENNNYYVDCICDSFSPSREYRYRVYFKYRKQDLNSRERALTFYVNGEPQVLRSEGLEASCDDYRPYEFIEGENFTVTCKKDKTLKGDIKLYFEQNVNIERARLLARGERESGPRHPAFTSSNIRTMFDDNTFRLAFCLVPGAPCCSHHPCHSREVINRLNLMPRHAHIDHVFRLVAVSVPAEIGPNGIASDDGKTPDVFVNTSEITVPYRTLQHNIHKLLVCSINNTDVQRQYARIGFQSVLPELGIRILGLPKKNIMYQYTNNSTWTVAYQFSVNETLNVTCATKSTVSDSDYKFLWKFEDETLASDATVKASAILVTNTSFVKVLTERHNQTHLKCIYQRKNITAEIVLHLPKPEPSSQVDELAGAEAQDDSSMVDLIIITAVAGILVIAVATISFVFWLKRKKHARLIENAYEYIQNPNESPIPAFPSQWENEYSYCTKTDANNTYASVNDRQSKSPSEHHYTEIDYFKTNYFKPKSDRDNVTFNSAQPIAGASVDELNADNFNHEKDYKGANNQFKQDYEINYHHLNHDLPINRKNDTNCNVLQTVKNKGVSFQENKKTHTQDTRANNKNPFRNNTNPDAVITKESKLLHYENVKDNLKLDNMQAKDMHYENATKDGKALENSSIYAESYPELDRMVINTMYG